MAIKAECPLCHRKQAAKNKVCSCGQDMDKAKRAKRVKFHITYRLNGKQKQEFVGYSIEEARDADGKRRSQKAEGRAHEILEKMAEERLTFRDLAGWFLPIEKVRLRTEGKKEYSRTKMCLNRFNEEFGDRLVRDIGPEDLENYRAKRHSEGMTKRTIDYEVGAAKKMVKTAWHANKVSGRTVKVFDAVKKLLKAGANARASARSLDEYLAIHEGLPAHQKPLFDLGLYTGMRPGEMIPVRTGDGKTRGLTWDGVDFKKREIILNAEDTKTGESRKIPITDEILKILRRIRRDLRSQHVFVYKGKPFSDTRNGVRQACEAAGIPYGMKVTGGFVFRDLRSTAKTLMARSGIDIAYRNALLGHAQQGMDRHYMSPDFERDLRQAMAQFTSWLKTEIEARFEGKAEKC